MRYSCVCWHLNSSHRDDCTSGTHLPNSQMTSLDNCGHMLWKLICMYRNCIYYVHNSFLIPYMPSYCKTYGLSSVIRPHPVPESLTFLHDTQSSALGPEHPLSCEHSSWHCNNKHIQMDETIKSIACLFMCTNMILYNFRPLKHQISTIVYRKCLLPFLNPTFRFHPCLHYFLRFSCCPQLAIFLPQCRASLGSAQSHSLHPGL